VSQILENGVRFIIIIIIIIIIIMNTDIKWYTDTILKHTVRCRTNIIYANNQILAA